MAPKKGGPDKSLGRSLVRKKRDALVASTRHTTGTDAGDGPPVVSVTENTSVEEFLSNAEAAQRSFEALRGIAAIATSEIQDASENRLGGGDSGDEEDLDEGGFFTIPRKPNWKAVGSAEEFKQAEQDAFLKWKKTLNRLQNRLPNLPPFEKNIEFWRQLWKMVEISDVVVQVVDARDPLFFISQDLCQYVKEVAEASGRRKSNVVLVNKADFLTTQQRKFWLDYFRNELPDLHVIFFSAVPSSGQSSGSEGAEKSAQNGSEEDEDIVGPFVFLERAKQRHLLTCSQDNCKSADDDKAISIGMVGYPNVGKSSTVNRLLENKRVQTQVSATPGKTKHVQTHVLQTTDAGRDRVVLVDGPGLVIPNLSMTKADMVLSGILPIDNLREDPAPCIRKLLEDRVPFAVVARHYGIARGCLDQSYRDTRSKGFDREARQLMSALALMRGYTKPGGVPDDSRAARLLLKDLVSGKLRYCRAPPGVDQAQYSPEAAELAAAFCDHDEADDDLPIEVCFPKLQVSSEAHVRGKRNALDAAKRHGNRKKREKLRRIYGDADG